ncbi:hypothetical protein [Xanthomonas oryzae]|uniref:hypothetical protein n=1 Tax=Xanthomonas oryzae TaxID=347 RepID=UPI0011BF48FF|nr:hypothetical protein [Xanthomonas oryzae]
MRELNLEEIKAVAGGISAGCSRTTTTTTNADGSTTTTTTTECHVSTKGGGFNSDSQHQRL